MPRSRRCHRQWRRGPPKDSPTCSIDAMFDRSASYQVPLALGVNSRRPSTRVGEIPGAPITQVSPSMATLLPKESPQMHLERIRLQDRIRRWLQFPLASAVKTKAAYYNWSYHRSYWHRTVPQSRRCHRQWRRPNRSRCVITSNSLSLTSSATWLQAPLAS